MSEVAFGALNEDDTPVDSFAFDGTAAGVAATATNARRVMRAATAEPYPWEVVVNFEWALGYAQRFGLVHVDYETQKRTIKDGGRYARVARTNEVAAA